MHPAQAKERFGETSLTDGPEGGRKRADDQRLEIDGGPGVEIHPLKFGDVLQQVGIGDVSNDVVMQLPAVRINKGDGEAGGESFEPRQRL